jgi:hypothetical protein
MNRSEWLTSQVTMRMLLFLRRECNKEQWTSRKKRLFAAACCRRFLHQLKDTEIHKAVEASERFADGLFTWEELCNASRVACEAAMNSFRSRFVDHQDTSIVPHSEFQRRIQLRGLAGVAVNTASFEASCATVPLDILDHVENPQAEMAAQCDLLRCMVGDPFHPLSAIAPSCLRWNDRTVVRLAEAAYEKRILPAGTLDSGRLAVLSDALEESGCDQADLLQHLRSPGPHTRGCHALDVVLGR